VNDALHPVNVHVHRTMLTRIASDHFPLVAELRKASALELAMSKQDDNDSAENHLRY
jgi:hypothetical protein